MTGAVVLAAGSSSRMGQPKAELPAGEGGKTFLETILAALSACGVEIVRVVVAPGAPAAAGAITVVNPEPRRGMLSSVQCGVRALPAAVDALLLWPVDHPLVRPETVLTLLDAHRASPAAVVLPVFEGRRGHPALFSGGAIRELLAADPAEGARQVVHAHSDRLEIAVGDPGVVTGVDTPEDYRRAFAAAR